MAAESGWQWGKAARNCRAGKLRWGSGRSGRPIGRPLITQQPRLQIGGATCGQFYCFFCSFEARFGTQPRLIIAGYFASIVEMKSAKFILPALQNKVIMPPLRASTCIGQSTFLQLRLQL